MSQEPSARKMRSAMLERLTPLGFRRAPDPECLDAHLGDEAIARVRINSWRVDGTIHYEAGLALTYPKVNEVYDVIWEVRRDKIGTYFPLACQLRHVDPSVGLFGVSAHAHPSAQECLGDSLVRAIDKILIPMASISAARAHMRDEASPWYSLMAYENYLPAVLMFESGALEASAFVADVLRDMRTSGASEARIAAYQRLSEHLTTFIH